MYMNYYYDCEVLGDRIEETQEFINESNIMDTMLEGRNRVIDQINTGEFQIYNICDVMDWIYFTLAPGKNQWEMSYDWECEKVKEFCENFNVYLYEKPRENFFKWEGVEEAYKANKRGVILSDLS